MNLNLYAVEFTDYSRKFFVVASSPSNAIRVFRNIHEFDTDLIKSITFVEKIDYIED